MKCHCLYFMDKITKKNVNLLSAEFAQRLVKVNILVLFLKFERPFLAIAWMKFGKSYCTTPGVGVHIYAIFLRAYITAF